MRKPVLDSARDSFRQFIHDKLSKYEKDSVLQLCIEQLDELSVEYQENSIRLTNSLEHDVDYDRKQNFLDVKDKYIKESRNLRYLLECKLSASNSGNAVLTLGLMIDLVASIDWLFVLYGASDVIHNGIEVAGLNIDTWFIPEVFLHKGS